MPTSVKSYAVQSANSRLESHTTIRRDLLDDDVLIKILFTGVCHSDIHVAHNDWKNSTYPVIPGHEIVGIVHKVGSSVKDYSKGDLVAVGCIVDSCGNCSNCNNFQEMFCRDGMTGTYNSPEKRFPGHITAGGYSQKIVVCKKFVFQIPKSLQSPELLPGVAPLLCAGITVYSPLKQYNVTSGSKVAIVGLGGLGHMGVKLAKAIGAEVTVISRTHEKDEYAYSLGASRVIASSKPEELKDARETFDLVLDTIPWDHDITTYIPLVAALGGICIVGNIGQMETPLSDSSLLFGNKRISVSVLGGTKETEELLQLCARELILADYELIRAEQINEAWETLSSGGTAKRFVVDINSMN